MFLFPLLLAFYTVAKAEVAFEKVSPILTARRGSVGGILFNEEHSVDEIWVVGGSNSGVSNQDVGKNVEVYTPSINQWRTGPPMEFSRCDHGAATIQKQTLYVAGGMTSCKDIKAQNICNTSDAAMFSTTTKTWTTLPSMNQARRGLSLAADEKNGIIYAVGGMNCMSNCYSTPVEYLTTLEAFEVALGTWTVLPSMHVGRRDLATALHGDILFAFGGCGGDGTVLDYAHCQALSTVEMYNPSTRQWTILNDMASPRHGFALGIFYFPMQGSGSGV
jgi:N-acetylneuraminic acid mutarotase